ncbi:MAG: ATP-dependent DNA helicase RecG [Holosporales bacterium]
MISPHPLETLFKCASTLPGIGAQVLARLKKLTGRGRVIDLLYHMPTGVQHWRTIARLKDAQPGEAIRCLIRINDVAPGKTPRQPHRVGIVDSGGGQGEIVLFNTPLPILERRFAPGVTYLMAGTMAEGRLLPTFLHPSLVAPGSAVGEETALPIYPLTAGLLPQAVRRYIQAALTAAPNLPEWLSPESLDQFGGMSWKAALGKLHQNANEQARRRLAYDELLARAIAFHRWRNASGKPAIPLVPTIEDMAVLRAVLPFTLTNGQEEAITAILNDMNRTTPMLRLLQGDVGSGKTIIAFFAIAATLSAGAQAALLVPTEILARQHAEKLTLLAGHLGHVPRLLLGQTTKKERKNLLSDLADGNAGFVIGTHALFEDDVVFNNLGLVVMDEQHRFGVQQRLRLVQKGTAPHVLVMTATPIPRTLHLVTYHGMDTSILKEKPPGRQPIRTTVLRQAESSRLLERLEAAIANGDQAYWVCPLVEQSEKIDLAAAIARFHELEARFGAGIVGLLHGRMKAADKEAAMGAFSRGETRLLVVTTVVEVGVDVPNASIMIIEHAERFGLAQLHQLRGRVGRGEKPSSCVLMHGVALSAVGKQRLQAMVNSQDGFYLAEVDLQLRGAGDVVGTAQSGMPLFRAVHLPGDEELVTSAHAEAEKRCNSGDPALGVLLELFGRGGAEELGGAG